MILVLKILSLVALVITILPSLLYVNSILSLDTLKWLSLAGTLVWFVVTPLWMGRTLGPDSDQVRI